MAVYFASDLHLKALDDPNVERFFAFLERVAAEGEALYVLGDLFEAYIGDDDDDPLLARVAVALSRLKRQQVFLAHGNRDFLIGAAFANRARVQLLCDETVIALGNTRALLMHGDSLCTDDLAYQQFRVQSRSAPWQTQFLSEPLVKRRAFAEHARAQSQRHTSMSAAEIMDAHPIAIHEALARHAVPLLIHGHTHRPMVHRYGAAQRIVLPDWDAHASWLRWSGSTGELYARGRCERIAI